jgi:hypothetical protein
VLQRPPKPPRVPSPAAECSRLARQRRKRNEVCHTVVVGPDVYSMLTQLGWINEADLADRRKVDAAVAGRGAGLDYRYFDVRAGAPTERSGGVQNRRWHSTATR